LRPPCASRWAGALGVASNGSPALASFDPNGKDRVELHVSLSGKPGLALADENGKSNSRLRRALWMPIVVAVRLNPWLSAYYRRLRAAGKRPKVAMIAAMHKLLAAIYSVAKHRRPFVAKLHLRAHIAALVSLASV
jgi:hypothetical protein